MEFKNAEIKTKANVYYDGCVTSRTVITSAGEKKTLGIMLPGTYCFSPGEPERIVVTQGHCRVRVGGDKEQWNEYRAGGDFSVPAHTPFDIQVLELLDYVCHYGGAP